MFTLDAAQAVIGSGVLTGVGFVGGIWVASRDPQARADKAVRPRRANLLAAETAVRGYLAERAPDACKSQGCTNRRRQHSGLCQPCEMRHRAPEPDTEQGPDTLVDEPTGEQPIITARTRFQGVAWPISSDPIEDMRWTADHFRAARLALPTEMHAAVYGTAPSSALTMPTTEMRTLFDAITGQPAEPPLYRQTSALLGETGSWSTLGGPGDGDDMLPTPTNPRAFVRNTAAARAAIALIHGASAGAR